MSSRSRRLQAACRAETLRQHAAAVREMPVEAEVIDEPAAQIDQSGDRTSRSAEVIDEAALIAAICEGKLGIPRGP